MIDDERVDRRFNLGNDELVQKLNLPPSANIYAVGTGEGDTWSFKYTVLDDEEAMNLVTSELPKGKAVTVRNVETGDKMLCYVGKNGFVRTRTGQSLNAVTYEITEIKP